MTEGRGERRAPAARDGALAAPSIDEAGPIAATDEENYNRYMKYLTGCQYYFVDEAIDVSLVTYLKPGADTAFRLSA